MTASITTPWFDPLAIIDAYCRIVIDTNNRDLQMFANAPGDRVHIPKGAPRSTWEASIPSPVPGTPIVTYLPFLSNTGEQWTLTWRALEFASLNRWLTQLDVHGYKPTALGNLQKFHAANSALRTRINGASALQKHSLQQEALAVLLMTIGHPDSHMPSAPGIAAQAYTSQTMSQLLCADTTGTFLPLVIWDHRRANIGGFDRNGHREATVHTQARSRWRDRQHHGFSRSGGALQFYGKTWAATRATPTALYAGVEVEMELSTHTQTRLMQRTLYAICDEFGTGFGERLHIESDSSLPEQGLEVVLQPHEIHSLHAEQFWRKLWQAACLSSASNQGGRAGMHIHVSANPALERPGNAGVFPAGYPLQAEDYRQTTAFILDLATSMLAGGPLLWMAQPTTRAPGAAGGDDRIADRRIADVFNEYAGEPPAPTAAARDQTLYPVTSVSRDGRRSGAVGNLDVRDRNRTGVRFVTQVFGRPRSWDGTFAVPYFSLMRPLPHLAWERYRHINWNNERTIEFRIFGPNGFNVELDWINVSTQLASALVHFARAMALHLLRQGSNLAATGAPTTDFFNGLPEWLKPMLLLNSTDPAYGRPDVNIRVGVPFNTGGRYALEKPNPQGHPFMVGLRTAAQRDADSSYYWHDAITQLGPQNNSGMHAVRTAELYTACMQLWRRFVQFLERNSPQYDLLLTYLNREVIPSLPSDAQLAAVGRAIPMGRPVFAPGAPRTVPTPQEAQRTLDNWIIESGPFDPVPPGGATIMTDTLRQAVTQALGRPGANVSDTIIAHTAQMFNIEPSSIVRGAEARRRIEDLARANQHRIDDAARQAADAPRYRRRSRAQIDADNAAGLTLEQARARNPQRNRRL